MTAMPGRTIARNSSRANIIQALTPGDRRRAEPPRNAARTPAPADRPPGWEHPALLAPDVDVPVSPRATAEVWLCFVIMVPGAYSRPWTVARKGYGEAAPELCIRSFQCRFPYMINST